MSVYIHNNRTIAKNTLFLYIRTALSILISLYTSRIILQTLGVQDFGIYQVVGGIVAMLSYLNGALSTGSSRYLTYELGCGDLYKLKRTFGTTFWIHFFLALIIVFIAETIGLWFLYHKIYIPIDRFNAALWSFHLSVIATFFNITQVPYTAVIVSHEKMDVYAYVAIIEAVLKLLIVIILPIVCFDSLIFYFQRIFLFHLHLL